MPASETPTNPTTTEEQERALASGQQGVDDGSSAGSVPTSPPSFRGRSGSRYVDYDTHELLEKISQYEDERRWQRIREGIWISILAHILLFSLLSWIPKYILHSPEVIDPIDAIKQRKDLTYLDELPDALKEIQKAKPKLPVFKPGAKILDKKTLEELRAAEKARPKPIPPKPVPQEQQPVPPQPTPVQPQVAQTPPSVAPPQPSPQIALDTPRPAPVPARPNFSLGPQNAHDQMQQAMRDSAHGQSGVPVPLPDSHLNLHPGSAGGSMDVLTDLQGVNFDNFFLRLRRETMTTWDPLIPEEVNPPISKRGVVAIRFKVLPNGRVMPNSMTLDGRSGDSALDRAAWGAITGSNYPPLPREFHGPYIELRCYFLYNPPQ